MCCGVSLPSSGPERHDQLEFRELLGQRDGFVPLGVREQHEEFGLLFFQRGDRGRQHRLGILDGNLRIGSSCRRGAICRLLPKIAVTPNL